MYLEGHSRESVNIVNKWFIADHDLIYFINYNNKMLEWHLLQL